MHIRVQHLWITKIFFCCSSELPPNAIIEVLIRVINYSRKTCSYNLVNLIADNVVKQIWVLSNVSLLIITMLNQWSTRLLCLIKLLMMQPYSDYSIPWRCQLVSDAFTNEINPPLFFPSPASDLMEVGQGWQSTWVSEMARRLDCTLWPLEDSWTSAALPRCASLCVSRAWHLYRIASFFAAHERASVTGADDLETLSRFKRTQKIRISLMRYIFV